ncbi:hypothetical protein GCM10008955_17700 [Deinococcus malanensis]|uniref:Uncharacterized protein n=1 Tax=Deinococcus malanensis TaxID=1706855 RepID=A0ABQ2ET54_9DEIO|nr:hypothetical protein GCM10008955_17700 [Deinococcus malanensis]
MQTGPVVGGGEGLAEAVGEGMVEQGGDDGVGAEGEGHGDLQKEVGVVLPLDMRVGGSGFPRAFTEEGSRKRRM